ncbi:IS1182 family transposase [Arcicella aquatica]|uniref:IS1182 family transposase n=1 Tax=Arcicella aquatica TaxID=217141 RepID=A0ABU5QV05_9BACT|nr:IS1182 family transposase [Arcicella aquatica]MEA5260921.1 IS1182 family transposase [Arcicella aquatica]
MAKALFKQLPAYSPELFPVNIFDKIPADHPVRLVEMVVNELDINHIMSHYKGGGTTAYHPRMLLKVLFYSYLSNVYSCRKIAKALEENIHFMYISGNSIPDFRTINSFRGQILKEHIHKLFAELVKMLVSMGYVSLEVQYIDGTKIESVSNRYSFVWKKSVEKNKAKLETKIHQILSDIEGSIQSDNQEVNKEELPQSINSQELKKQLSAINKRLKTPTKTQKKELKKLQDEHLPKLEKYELDLQTLGNRNSFSKTDHDATFLRLKDDHMKNGQLKPAYNAQISTHNQFITHVSIHQTATDTTTLESHLEGFENAYQQQSKEVVADAGYGSQENYELLEAKRVEAYIKYNYFHVEQKKKHKDNPFLVANLPYHPALDLYVCPAGQFMEKVTTSTRTSSNGYEADITHYQAKNCIGCPLREQCHQSQDNRVIQVNHRLNQLKAKAKELLNSPKGLEHRSKRPIEVEAVFGQMKSNNKFTRFTMRSLPKVELEFLLMAIGHNFRKMTTQKNNHIFTNLTKDISNLKNYLTIINQLYWGVKHILNNNYIKFA